MSGYNPYPYYSPQPQPNNQAVNSLYSPPLNGYPPPYQAQTTNYEETVYTEANYQIPGVQPVNMAPPINSIETSQVQQQSYSTVFPPIESPMGPLISVYIEDNSHHQKRNRRIGGIGVTAAASVLTGGLIVLPVLAGVAVNKIAKSSSEKCIFAYRNTFIYELRAALARGFGVPPEYLQLKRKGVFLDDRMQLVHYLSFPGKQRIHLTTHIKDQPVVGSVCTYPRQYEYPPVQFVDCSSFKFVL